MSTVLTIYSVEEQVGKTIFGINLGVSLRNETQKSVIFVDLSANEEGVLGGTLLKIAPLTTLKQSDVTIDGISRHIQHHSSHLHLLTIDTAVIQEEYMARAFIIVLLTQLRELFDYIVIDTASHSYRITHEALDAADIVLLLSTSWDQEYPIEIIGKLDVRHIVNMPHDHPGRVAAQHPAAYVIPEDIVAVDAFRKSGVPFVVQLPYRPISQKIARLARDIGKKLLGISFTGWAALGLTQIGILEVFEYHRIAIDMLVGAGFGALIGAVYASGTELPRFSRDVVKWAVARKYGWSPFRKESSKERNLQTLCETFLQDVYFEELLIPMHVTAFNLQTGREVVFREGKVLDAVKASMRVPGVFAPFKQPVQSLIDSSVFAANSTASLRQMGAHLSIVVQVTLSPKQQRSLQQTMRRRLPAEYQTTERLPGSSEPQIAPPDVAIMPDITGISWREFYKVNELIEAGRRVAEQTIPQIEELKGRKN